MEGSSVCVCVGENMRRQNPRNRTVDTAMEAAWDKRKTELEMNTSENHALKVTEASRGIEKAEVSEYQTV